MTHHTNISQRLHEDLGHIITTTAPGAQLPSEPELARRLGVSRATLREAMRTYETQGMIYRRQGAGTFVMHPSQVIESGLEVLESIDTMAKRIGLPVSSGELQVECRPSTEKEAEALKLEPGDRVIAVSRVILAEERPVAFLVDILPDHILSPAEVQTEFSGSVLDLLLRRGKPMPGSSRCEINAVPASPEVARAMCIQRGDGLLRFVAYLYATDGSVIDYSFSYFLPGYFHFHVVRRVG